MHKAPWEVSSFGFSSVQNVRVQGWEFNGLGFKDSKLAA